MNIEELDADLFSVVLLLEIFTQFLFENLSYEGTGEMCHVMKIPFW